jgi:hypothetical protein
MDRVPRARKGWNGVIIAGFVVLLVVAPLAMFAGDARIAAGLACCLAGLALWRAATLQERERARRSRPSDAASVIRQLSALLVQRRREPIVSEEARQRGREYATGVQDGAYATLDEVIDRLAEALRLLPPAPGERSVSARRRRRAQARKAQEARRAQSHRARPGGKANPRGAAAQAAAPAPAAAAQPAGPLQEPAAQAGTEARPGTRTRPPRRRPLPASRAPGDEPPDERPHRPRRATEEGAPPPPPAEPLPAEPPEEPHRPAGPPRARPSGDDTDAVRSRTP